MSTVNALRRSGRFIVIVATWSEIVRRMSDTGVCSWVKADR
jgi:hypothetical protein